MFQVGDRVSMIAGTDIIYTVGSISLSIPNERVVYHVHSSENLSDTPKKVPGAYLYLVSGLKR